MLYFEDALWIRENFWKDAIGTLYFALGFSGIAFHLIIISILPEISNFISHPAVLILSSQFTASLIQLFVVFVPVPAMIAVNQPYFVNPVMINVPAFLLILSQCFAFVLVIIIGFYRSLRIVSSKAGKLIFPDKVIYVIIIGVFCFSFFFTVNICAHTTIRRFNPSELNWKLQYFEVISFIYLVAFIIVPTTLFSLIALSFLIYKKLFQKPHTSEDGEDEDETDAPRETICSLFFYIIFDLFFCFWICMSFLSSVPFLSLSHVFLTAYWPLMTSLTLDVHIRAALFYRIRNVFQPQSANSPIVIRPNKKETVKFSKF